MGKSGNEVLQEIKLRFRDYLISQGVTFKSGEKDFAYCPLHDDGSTASLHMRQEGTRAHCFGSSCEWSGDVFDFAHALHGYPRGGREFWTVTIMNMARDLGIPYDPDLRSPKERTTSNLYSICRAVKDLLVVDKKVLDWLKGRGFKNVDKEMCKKYGLGRIPNHTKMIDSLKTTYSMQSIKATDVTRSSIFENRIVFTLFSDTGTPIGFTGRWIDKPNKEENDAAQKYINSCNTPVFQKRNCVYNINYASRIKEAEEILVVEGTTDVHRLLSEGYPCVVAILQATPSQEQIEMIQATGKRVVWVMDGDKGGRDAIVKMLNAHDNSLAVHIPKNMDVDEYIRKKKLRAFMNLPRWDALQWAIHFHNSPNPNREHFALRVIKKIVKTNDLMHNMYLRDLHEVSGIPYVKLLTGLRQLRKDEMKQEFKEILDEYADKADVSLNFSVNIDKGDIS